jgi:formate C-acetyltransferase
VTTGIESLDFSSIFEKFIPGHRNVLRYGYNGLKQMAKDRLESLNENEQEFEKKCNFLQSVIIVLDAVIKFVKRVSHHALSMANESEDPQRKKELKEISEICQNIAEAPPTTFKEALQLIYFNQLICGLEDGGFAVSVGRLDQDLYPYYAKDLKDGILDQSEVDFLLKCFFIKLTGLWNYIFALGANAGEGPPIAENLTIGGLDRAGKDATNELSFQILEAYTHLQTVQPTFSARIHQKTSKRFLETLSDSIKNGTSIALFNDEVMVPGLVNRGFTLEDAREYAPVGCVEPQHPYKSFGSTNSNQLNIVKCLELAFTNGMDLFARKEYGASSDIKIESYEDLWKAFEKQVSYFIENMVKSMNYLDCAIAELDPQPFLSATTSNCIQNAQDVTQGGSVYNFTGPQLIGLATAADSLAVIKKLVFEEQQLELEDLIQILKKNYRGNYKGKTGKEWREIFINKVPKFGNDIDYVDQIAVNVAELFCREVSKWDNFRGGKYNPGIYSTSLHLAFGTFTGASADGRKSRDTLSNGVGPTHGRDTNGPTAILNSVKKLKNELMTNGHSLILAFHPNNLEREIFVPLVKTYCEPEGGFQIQFNVIGKETLCEAQEHPQKYQGLVVRIAGYSVYFTEISKAAQDEIIARTIF